MTIDLAFLLALLTALGLGVYALRVTAERNRWRARAEKVEQPITVRWGRDIGQPRYVHTDVRWTHTPKPKRRK